MIRHSSNPRRGFSLVEVLATMMLMGIVLPVAMHGISIALGAAGTARNLAQAATLAEAKLNEIIVRGDATMLGTSGDFGTEFPGYRWQCQSGAGNFSTAEVTEIAVSIIWLERGQERSLNVSTLSYSPTTTSAQGTQGVLP